MLAASIGVQNMSRQPYTTDLTDEQFSFIKPLLPLPKPLGRKRTVDYREVINAIFYVNRNGIIWANLPRNFPPYKTVNGLYNEWRKSGLWDDMLLVLREMVREQEQHQATPSAAALDSQSTKTGFAQGTKGYDGGKKIYGRKRHILVDSLGLLLGVVVTGADVPDAVGAQRVMSQMTEEDFPRLEKIWADNAYLKYKFPDWLKQNFPQMDLEIKRKAPGMQGFHVIKKDGSWSVPWGG